MAQLPHPTRRPSTAGDRDRRSISSSGPAPLGDVGRRLRRLQIAQVAVLVLAGLITVIVTIVLAGRLNHLGGVTRLDQEALQDAVELRDGLRLEEVGYWSRLALGDSPEIPMSTRRAIETSIRTVDQIAERDSDNPAAMKLALAVRGELEQVRDSLPPPGQAPGIGDPRLRASQLKVGTAILGAETAFRKWIDLETREIAEGKEDSDRVRNSFVQWLIGTITILSIAGLVIWLLLERARRRLTASLDERRASQAALLVALQDGLVSAAGDGTIREVNDAFCAMTGFDREELIGSTPPHPYWVDDEQHTIASAVGRALSGEGGEYDLTFRRRDGDAFPVIANISPLVDEQGGFNGYVGTFKNVAERRLAEAARVREEATAEGLRRAIEARDAERAHLARELHDDTAHGLAIMGLQIDALEDHIDGGEGTDALNDLRESVLTTLAGVRALATELRPPTLREYGLSAAIERQAMRLHEIAGTDVTVDLNALPPDLNEELQVTLFRVAHEALANVARHSGARTAHVSVTVTQDTLSLIIADDGRGFDPLAPTDRLGLAGMRERLDLVGGSLTTRSEPGGGTTLVAEVPVRLAAAEQSADNPLAGASPHPSLRD